MASYNLDQRPDESLQQYYRRLAKTADQRMVRLEKATHEKYFKTAGEWAYAKAKRDIRSWYPKGLKPKRDEQGNEMLRWNTKPPEGDEQLISKINDIKDFLESPTSTKAGIKNVYKKKADTVNKKYGTNFKWDDLAKYYDSGQAELWDAKFGSKTALKTIGEIQKLDKEVIKKIKEAKGKDIRIPEIKNKVLEQTVIKALKDNNLNIEDLFK